MISRATLARNGQRALRCHGRSNASRCLATAASGSFSYETGDVAGLKVASRDLPGATTHLAVVAKAGTRYQPLPGYSEALEKFSFKVRTSRPMTAQFILNGFQLPLKSPKADCYVHCFTEYLETICPKDNEGNGATRRRVQLLPLKGESHHWRKILTR